MKGQATQFDPARLVDLLTQQRDLYRSLHELSEKQRSMISGDRPELLLNILRDRQDLVASLARLNEELGPYRRNWDAVYAALPDEQRSRSSEVLHEINGLLRRILRSDQEDSALLSARKQAIGTEIADTSGGQAANHVK
ncbi:MAG: hypothetical protein KAY37_00390 [Phycisphaerae bacterium]|nr:hypothetical protein [Phycisphaerae bacterium]